MKKTLFWLLVLLAIIVGEVIYWKWAWSWSTHTLLYVTLLSASIGAGLKGFWGEWKKP